MLLVCLVALSGCTTFKPPQISYDADVPPLPIRRSSGGGPSTAAARSAVLDASQGRQERSKEAKEPVARIETANDAARVEPRKEGYFNAVQVFPFSPGALYQIYAAPGQITDIALEPGEQLTGSGPVVGRRHRALDRRRYRKRKWRYHDASISWSSRRGLQSRPISSSTLTGAPI